MAGAETRQKMLIEGVERKVGVKLSGDIFFQNFGGEG